MGVLKYNSVRCTGGVDIPNTVEFHRPQVAEAEKPANAPTKSEISDVDAAENESSAAAKSRYSAEEILVQRET